jgi:hypothetical protein
MITPQQFLGSFLREKAAAYAEANALLAPVHAKYFGEPLSKHAHDFLLRDGVELVVEDVRQNGASASLITRERFRAGDVRIRYHLESKGESWKIVRIDRECFLCRGTGRSGGAVCQKCNGEGWYDPRENVA